MKIATSTKIFLHPRPGMQVAIYSGGEIGYDQHGRANSNASRRAGTGYLGQAARCGGVLGCAIRLAPERPFHRCNLRGGQAIDDDQ